MRKLALALTAMSAIGFGSAADAAIFKNSAFSSVATTASLRPAATTLATNAAPVITTGAPVITGDSGSYSGRVVCDATCAFTTTLTFAAPAGYTLQSAGIGSNYTSGNLAANIDFTSVMLNGVEFDIQTTGQQEFRNLFDQALQAMNTITVSGTAGEGATGAVNATFAGTLSFGNAPTGAVPEPATWAMMLMGFGAVGYGMRRQRRSSTRLLQAA